MKTFSESVDEVAGLLKRKNAAYGNSALEPVRIFSRLDASEGLRVRIDDKLSRLHRGDGSGDEDAILDLIGYLILLRISLDSKAGSGQDANQEGDDMSKTIECQRCHGGLEEVMDDYGFRLVECTHCHGEKSVPAVCASHECPHCGAYRVKGEGLVYCGGCQEHYADDGKQSRAVIS